MLPLALAVALLAAAPAIEVILELDAGGSPGEIWIELLRRRLAPDEVARAAALRKPLSPAERAWADRIRGQVATWTTRLGGLAEPFEPVTPPRAVRVVLGNRGGDDAFTHDPSTIGFDLARLHAEYGDAGSEENRARIDRLFDHEYTHLLQKAWLPDHPQPAVTPLDLALVEMWTEGLGNYRSMSERWRAEDGRYAPTARAALDELEPLLVERLTALACATPEAAARLTADLSRGPFARKWGALPVALWLDAEASRSPAALRRFVQAGAAAVVDLAERRLPPALAAGFAAARARGAACPGS